MRIVHWQKYFLTFIFALLTFQSCSSSPEFISEVSVEDKVARLRIGQSDKNEVESIFGTDHGNDRSRWIYQFADQQFEIAERRQGPGLGALPISAGVVPTNTRAVVTVAFNEAGIVKAVEVARFFDVPFVNDYWYLIKTSAKEPLDAIAAIGGSVGFKAAGMDKDSGTFSLEDPSSKARLSIKLDGQTLRVTSRNPYHRLANEYRAYTKRESAFTDAIANSDLVQ